jgi:hypothetical protein
MIMDDRFAFRPARVFLAATVLAVLALAGCTSGLATAMWLLKGPNIPAEYKCLKDQNVAVVCRGTDIYNFPTVPKELSQKVASLLKSNVPKIRMVNQREVDQWMDNNDWDEYLEVGRALKADRVLGIEVEQFSIYQGQTLYQGKANIVMKVYDCQTGDLLVDKPLPQSIHPPNSAKSTSDVQEIAFRREFVGVLADQIARHFYAHDPRAYFAADAAYMH